MNERTSPEEFGLLFKRFLDDIVNRAEVPEGALLKRLREHLGGEPMRMPVISEEFERFQQPNLQVAMDAYLERPGNSAELIGLAAENKRNWGFGLYLMRVDGAPLVAFVSGPNENMGPTRARARVEVMAPERASAQRFLADITKLMGERNVY